MKVLFNASVYFIALWLDLFFANNGYQSAFVTVMLIYMIVTYNWAWALPFAIVSFVIYDNLNALSILPFIMVFTFIGVWWKDNADCSRWWLMSFPYFGVIFVQYWLFYFFANLDVLKLVKYAFISLIITLPLGLFLTVVFNKISWYLGLPRSDLNEERHNLK